jgi:copper transport protein
LRPGLGGSAGDADRFGVGALRPSIGGGAGGGEPSGVGALRPGLAGSAGDADRSGVGALRPGLGPRPRGDAPAGTAVGFEPSLAHALLVVLGAGAIAGGLAVARAAAGDAVTVPAAACVRGASYLGLVLAAGSLAFMAVVWPAGLRVRRLATMVWLGWLIIGAGTLLQLALNAMAGTMSPGGDRVATALLLRLGVLLVSLTWVSAARRGRNGPRLVGPVLFVALSCTWVYAGPASPGWLTAVVTVVHIAAACLWVGGLAVLAVVLLPRGTTPSLAGALTRFSRVAPVCVAVLAVSGAFHGWSRAGSVGDLSTSVYGHAFWLKVAAVLAMLLVANGNRLYVARHVAASLTDGSQAGAPETADADGRADEHAHGDGDAAARAASAAPSQTESPPLQLLGLFLGAEIAFGLVVIVLTGVLVGAPVAR